MQINDGWCPGTALLCLLSCICVFYAVNRPEYLYILCDFWPPWSATSEVEQLCIHRTRAPLLVGLQPLSRSAAISSAAVPSEWAIMLEWRDNSFFFFFFFCWPFQTNNLLHLCLYPQQCESATDKTIYQYSARTLNGSRTVNFSDYMGKSVLFVNVATYWGYTFQYVGKIRHHRLFCVALFKNELLPLTALTFSPVVRTECTTWGNETSWTHHPRLSLQPIWETGTRAETRNSARFKVRCFSLDT